MSAGGVPAGSASDRRTRISRSKYVRQYDVNHKKTAGLGYDRGEVRRTETEVVKTITKESLTTMTKGRS